MKLGSFELDLKQSVHVMGILNVTPDSFADGGRWFNNPVAALDRALMMAGEGAAIIDIGGESSRPGSHRITANEEWQRIEPLLQAVVGRLRIPVSVDTMKAEVARRAIMAGASMINDISAGTFDPRMIEVVADSEVAYVALHMQGTPETMQVSPVYDDVVGEVARFLRGRLADFKSRGLSAERVILDPGIGFGKRQEDNLALLANLNQLLTLGRPLLVGVSKKSFIGNILHDNIQNRLEGSLAAAAAAVLNGATLIRAHDVAPTVRAVSVAAAIRLASVDRLA